MATLQEIINGNIEWFWKQDPSVWFDAKTGYRDLPVMVSDSNVEKLWNDFKSWCLQNCKEVCDGKDEPFVPEEDIETGVNGCFEGWLRWQQNMYPERVQVSPRSIVVEERPSLADMIADAEQRKGLPAGPGDSEKATLSINHQSDPSR